MWSKAGFARQQLALRRFLSVPLDSSCDKGGRSARRAGRGEKRPGNSPVKIVYIKQALKIRFHVLPPLARRLSLILPAVLFSAARHARYPFFELRRFDFALSFPARLSLSRLLIPRRLQNHPESRETVKGNSSPPNNYAPTFHPLSPPTFTHAGGKRCVGGMNSCVSLFCRFQYAFLARQIIKIIRE